MILLPSSRGRRLAGVALTAALVAAPAAAPPGATALERGADAAAQTGPRYRDASLPTAARVADLLGRMTLAEKVGQMTQAERADVTADPSLITEYGLGSVLSGGGSVPANNTAEGWADMVDTFQRAALDTRLGIPLLYGVDAVHGHANLQGATVFPHNIGLGATRNARLVERIAHITAAETRASGPQWNFAPCVCVARDDRWGRTYESFGEHPRLATVLGAAAVRGLQGPRGQLDRPDRVLATAKHYAGDGLTTFGTGEGDYTIDQGITQTSREEFDELALAPYRAVVRGRDAAGSVMPSFSSVDWTEDGLGNPVKMHAHEELLTDVLRGDLGFEGFVISDWRAIHQIPGDLATQVATSVNAGVDMFMEPASGTDPAWREFVPTLIGLVEAGTVSQGRIDEAVSRILTAKFELGLFERPFTDRRNLDEIGSRGHRAVARQAVAESQVLLRNRERTLPLGGRHHGRPGKHFKPGKHGKHVKHGRRGHRHGARPVYVAGSNADNIGNQAGGWTLTWQGGSTNVIPGDTILDGIRGASRARVTFSETATARVPRGADGVVVVGETPYAEGFGDVGGPRWGYDPGDNGVLRPPQTMELTDADEAAVRTVCAQARSCTVVVVSGRPMALAPDLLRRVDALVASWLPGSEGRGVADVLFGRRPFTGRLPVSWPRTVDQEPVNIGDEDYDPLYRYGFGLTTRRQHR
ncbi:glycoside hydrolase family 3 protein [Nocardioides pantholopis]|uniref:glycoside hydrolase family 3 protein n=1 Tax=Nocardioides pantholopis TaxID=2483798 RepID=UPI000F07468E|nr:glycoside hydrolase family 3 protein [Nocardioides pantholopis]